MTGLLRRSMWKCVGGPLVGRPWKLWIDTMKFLKKEVWMSGKQREWSRIRVNGRGL